MRRGRPREVENPVRVSVRLSADEYDQLNALGKRLGKSVPRIVRAAAKAAAISASKYSAIESGLLR